MSVSECPAGGRVAPPSVTIHPGSEGFLWGSYPSGVKVVFSEEEEVVSRGLYSSLLRGGGNRGRRIPWQGNFIHRSVCVTGVNVHPVRVLVVLVVYSYPHRATGGIYLPYGAICLLCRGISGIFTLCGQ